MSGLELDYNAGEVFQTEMKAKLEQDGQRQAFWRNMLKDNNIYDIRDKCGLYYVIGGGQCRYKDSRSKAAVFANLYYEDEVDECCQYLKEIPQYIDVYIFSSKKEVLEHVRQNMYERASKACLKLIYKENRGRDISALLVAGRKYALNYDYICFVHDKKSSQYDQPMWSKSFFYNIWENTLKSRNYIESIIDLFEKNKEMGVLAIPEPIHGCYFSYLGREWGRNFDNTEKLCTELNIKCKLEHNKSPITLGTAFWCRTDAIRDVLEHNFRYSDFPSEPMQQDGTISHALERIWGYAAQSRGYYTGTVMNNEYASMRMSAVQALMIESVTLLRKYRKCELPSDVLNPFEERLREYCEKYSTVFIYGAGDIGRKCAEWFEKQGIKYAGFIVSEGENRGDNIYKLSEVSLQENTGVVVAVSKKYEQEIVENLEHVNYNRYFTMHS